MSRSVGCGAAGAGSCPRLLAEHPDHAAQLLECLACRGAQQGGGLLDLVRWQVRTQLEPSGVQRHQGDPVSEHVVHLPGDPGPFGHPGLLLVQLLVGLGSQGSLTQRQQQLPAGPDEHAPPAGGERQRHHEQHHGDGTGGRAVDGEGEHRRDPQQGDHHGGPGRAMYRQRRQREEAGRGRGGRDRPEQKARERDADRPSAPPPQRDAGEQRRRRRRRRSGWPTAGRGCRAAPD